jgi:hypothetical protein
MALSGTLLLQRGVEEEAVLGFFPLAEKWE